MNTSTSEAMTSNASEICHYVAIFYGFRVAGVNEAS